MHGYWTWDWADSYERIRKLDTAAHTIETWEPHGVYGYKEKQRYCYLNILEELDEPGEWYLDRRANNLYFWPPEPPEKGETCVSLHRRLQRERRDCVALGPHALDGFIETLMQRIVEMLCLERR
jgi:hypothetical protein